MRSFRTNLSSCDDRRVGRWFLLYRRRISIGVARLVLALLVYVVGPGIGNAGESGAGIVHPAGTDLDGLTIVRIHFIRRDIFDTTMAGTTAWPYRTANALHVTTTESFIRSMLLLSEGDPYDAAIAEESARILRETDLVNPVEITARKVEGGVEVTVDTRDRWTLQVGANFGLSGNRSKAAFSVTEKNILGHGWALDLEYRSDNERSGWAYSFYHPNLFGSRWRTRLEHRDASDGSRDLIRVDSPFYSLGTKRAGGFEWDDYTFIGHLYSKGHSVVEGNSAIETLGLWTGFRLPLAGPWARRVIVGLNSVSESYDDWSWEGTGESFEPPESIEIRGLRFGYEQIADRFRVVQGFRSWVSQEDVAFGPNFNVGLTVSLPSFGGDIKRFLFDGSLQVVRSTNGWLFESRGWTSGRLDEGDLHDFVIGGQLVAAQIGDRSWMVRLMAETSVELDRNRQFALGADTGLRGWDPDYFDGIGRAVANVQWRVKLKDDVLHLFSLGAVAFIDAGHTWGARVGVSTERVHADIGVGLVADVPQIGLVKLLRIEVAFPDDGSGYTAIITTSGLF